MVAQQTKPEETNGHHLNGMKEIAEFLARSESTVLSWKQQYPTMPIAKIGGAWCGDRRDLDQWRRLHIQGLAHQYEPGQTEEVKKPVKKKESVKNRKKQ